MIRIDVRGIREVQANLRALPEKLQGLATQAAINKVAAGAQTEINRAIRDEYAVRSEDVRSSIAVRKAQRGRLAATVEIFGSPTRRGRSMNMVRFLAAVQGLKTRGTTGAGKKALAALERQLGFKIKKAGGLKKIEGAFLANKGRTVFRRTGDARLPIEPVQVIGYSQMFSSRKIRARVLARINRDLPVEVGRAVRMILARQR